MPEAATATPASTESSPEQIAAASNASEKAFAILDRATEGFSPIEQPPKEATPKTDPAPAKREVQPAKPTPPKETVKETPKIEDATKPTPKLYESYKSLQKRVSAELEPELQRLKKENEELKARKPEAPEMEEFKRIKEEREKYARDLAETAYERSDDYRRDHLEPRKALYDEAVNAIKSLSIRYVDGQDDEGKPIIKSRPATEADFRTIYFLPPAQQDRAITEWFGHSALRVSQYIGKMADAERAAQLAVQRHAETYTQKQKQQQEKMLAEKQQFDSMFKKAQGELEQKWPDYFKAPAADGDGADKELAEAYSKGKSIVEEYLTNAPELDAERRAAYTAVVVARASSWPALQLKNQRQSERIKELEAQVNKKNSGDPGTTIGTTGGDNAPEDEGIYEMAAAFKRQR